MAALRVAGTDKAKRRSVASDAASEKDPVRCGNECPTSARGTWPVWA